MSAPRAPTGAVIALLLGIADLLFLNLYVSPKVFADGDGETVAAAPAVPAQPRPTPDGARPQATDPTGRSTGPAIRPTGADPTKPDGPGNPDSPANPGNDPVAPAGTDPDPGSGAGPAPEPGAGTDPDPGSGAGPDAGAVPAPAPGSDPPVVAPPVRPAGDLKPVVHRMYFSQNRATIKSKHKKLLDRAVALLVQHPTSVAVVEAWADVSETKYGLPFLIKRRLNKVVRYLRKNGVAEDRIRTVNHGVGKSEDVFVNRRVRLRVEMP